VPTYYACQRCTACCRWPGEVRVTEAEIQALARHLGLSEDDFIQYHTRVRVDRLGLSLMEKPNGECIFLGGADCTVQPVKPRQCREFPNLWRFPGFQDYCQAVPREVSDEEYLRLTQTDRPPTASPESSPQPDPICAPPSTHA